MRVPLAAAVLLAAAACSPGASPAPDNVQVAAEAPVAVNLAVTAERTSAEVKAEAAPIPKQAAAPNKPARRCGWLSNPTPANWWLTDSEGQWILGTQGSEQAPGMDDMPDMSTAGWVETNGYYGYGCACMTITADGDGRVTLVADAQPKPLKQCRADRKLPKPE
ncbi:MAG TPA: DUF4087 domain-containing protein [Allosphingosinicella sp.]|nr:DUF4087 domain-containing protein [Allosphingosinicella sp.]